MAEYVFTLRNVRKAHGDKVVLDNVTLSFLHGAKIGVVGPNGTGKSSLLKIMAGLDQPNNGDAILDPEATVGMLQQERAEVVSSNPQELTVPQGPDRGRTRSSREQGQLPEELSSTQDPKHNLLRPTFVDHLHQPRLNHVQAVSLIALSKQPPGRLEVNLLGALGHLVLQVIRERMQQGNQLEEAPEAFEIV